jgi:hypothetical protein
MRESDPACSGHRCVRQSQRVQVVVWQTLAACEWAAAERHVGLRLPSPVPPPSPQKIKPFPPWTS